MTNEKLKEIEDRLFEKGNRHRDVAIKEIDAHARGYLLGVNDALAAVAYAIDCDNCPAIGKDGRCDECTTALVRWLNSPVKEGTE